MRRSFICSLFPLSEAIAPLPEEAQDLYMFNTDVSQADTTAELQLRFEANV